MPENEELVLTKYEVEAWVRPGRTDSVRESIEAALEADPFVSDFGVDHDLGFELKHAGK
jgi:hypothetical protein